MVNKKSKLSILEEAAEFYRQKHIAPLENIRVAVIPVTILNEQICDSCQNYLSVGPVRITRNSKIVCGRKSCSSSQLLNNTFQTSLYNSIAQKYFFNCINHYDGCKIILPFGQLITNHESVCEFRKTHDCIECQFQGNSCQFLQHYKRLHPQLLTNDGIFKIENCYSERNYLIFSTEHQILKVLIEIVNNQLNIFCERVTSCYNIEYYSVVIFKPTIEFEYVSKPSLLSKICSVDLSEVQKFITSEIFYGAIRIHTQTPLYRIDKDAVDNFEKPLEDVYSKVLKIVLNMFFRSEINCCNCKQIIKYKKDISFCPQSHVSCSNCLVNYCKICQGTPSWLNIKTLLANYKLFCDWRHCDKHISCLYFDNHKQICSKRDYECPVSACGFIGTGNELLNHWHDPAPLKFGRFFDFTTEKAQITYWIISYLQEMLRVEIKKVGLFTSIEIDETFVISSNSYKLEFWYQQNNEFFKWGDFIQRGVIKTFPKSFRGYDQYRVVVTVNENFILNDSPFEKIYTMQNKKSSEYILKSIITLFLKTKVKCCNCYNLINDKEDIYLCHQIHITCKHCSCSNCCKLCSNTSVYFNSLQDMVKDLRFSCDWVGCTEIISCWNFLLHKQTCLQRQYKCPLFLTSAKTNDGFIGTKAELNIHWHNRSRELKFGSDLDFLLENSYTIIYWITDRVNEFLAVKIFFLDDRPNLEVLEDNAVFPYNYKLTLYKQNVTKRYEMLTELKQALNKKSCNAKLYVNTNYRISIECVKF